jgi:hypothetical protein
MSRDLRTLEEINDWLTNRVRRDPRCRDATVAAQYRLREPDEMGCNWSRDIVVNAGTGDETEMREVLGPLFEEARRSFNVPH